MAARSILIIDPDAVTRAFVSNVLRQQEYAVVQVGSALDGLVIASRDRPNMVLFEPLTADMGSEEFGTGLDRYNSIGSPRDDLGWNGDF